MFLWIASTAWSQPSQRTDIREWLQAELDANATASIPRGDYWLSGTVTLPYKAGCLLEGVGACDPAAAGSNRWAGYATNLWYTGPASEPVIKITGSHVRLRGFGLHVGLPASESQAQGIGILLDKPGPGLGTGLVRADDIALRGFDVGLQIGTYAKQHNCDMSTWQNMFFSDCNIGVRQVNFMAMGHRFMVPFFVRCRRSFVVDAGGMMRITDATCIGGTFLTFTDAHTLRYRVGPNAGDFVVENLKVDAQHAEIEKYPDGPFELVETQGNCRAHVFVVGGRIGHNRGNPVGSEGTLGTRMQLTGKFNGPNQLKPARTVNVP